MPLILLISTFEFDDLEDSDHNDEQSTISSSKSQSSSETSDSGAEVWDETEEYCLDSETEAPSPACLPVNLPISVLAFLYI